MLSQFVADDEEQPAECSLVESIGLGVLELLGNKRNAGMSVLVGREDSGCLTFNVIKPEYIKDLLYPSKPETKKFYQSRTFKSAIAPLVAVSLRALGYDIPATDVIIVVGCLSMLWYRYKAVTQIGG